MSILTHNTIEFKCAIYEGNLVIPYYSYFFLGINYSLPKKIPELQSNKHNGSVAVTSEYRTQVSLSVLPGKSIAEARPLSTQEALSSKVPDSLPSISVKVVPLPG